MSLCVIYIKKNHCATFVIMFNISSIPSKIFKNFHSKLKIFQKKQYLAISTAEKPCYFHFRDEKLWTMLLTHLSWPLQVYLLTSCPGCPCQAWTHHDLAEPLTVLICLQGHKFGQLCSLHSDDRRKKIPDQQQKQPLCFNK